MIVLNVNDIIIAKPIKFNTVINILLMQYFSNDTIYNL
jgi:hypothetical protein